MEKVNNFDNFEQKFSSPEEELDYLRKKIVEREQEILNKEKYKPETNEVISETIDNYKRNAPENILEKSALISEKVQEEIILELSPEEHDDQMAELISLVQKKGIINVLALVEKMNDSHVYDDFHRFLIQYLKEGYYLKGFDQDSELAKTLGRVLFEVVLPDFRGKSEYTQEELFKKMEQFYSGMLSLGEKGRDDYLTIEIANAIGSKEFVFYASVSQKNRDLLEKQLLSVFPEAILQEQKNDFNVFNQDGESCGAYVLHKQHSAKPIKTFDEMGADPLNVLINIFSKLETFKDGATIQFVFKPVGDFYLKKYLKGLTKLEKGEKGINEFYIKNTTSSKMFSSFNKLISSATKDDKDKEKNIDSGQIEQVRKKTQSPIVSTNIRVITSAESESKAEDILRDFASVFNQFQNTNGNEFSFLKMKKSDKKKLIKNFIFRNFDAGYDMPLNLKECASVFHFPSEQKDLSSKLKTNKAKTAPAPNNISDSGVLLGHNKHQNTETEIFFNEKDRLRHFYVIGQTGTGKTTILNNMAIQDIENGEGVCMIDPHGSDIQTVLSCIPKERYEDVIYFDPANVERPMALNMLEYDHDHPEQKTFVVNELFSIFQKLYGANPESMGPMFEQYFRNATMLVIEDPDSGSTLLEVSRVMSDKAFRDLKLSRCKNPIVVQFWKEIAEKAGGEASLANIVPYIVSKFDVFLANDIMRPVVAQEKSSFNFRQIMDEKKILLVNLSKGRLGEINSSLIGLILVGKILMAALSRADSFGKDFPPFYLYIDEFQNVTTPSISTILSEARKYKLSLNIVHQYIDQLDENIKNSVFGNVGSMAVYRVGAEDAQFLESQFAPVFEAKDIMNMDNFHAYIKMLANGSPIKPFSLRALTPREGDKEVAENLKQLSYLKYGRDKNEVHSEIMKKYEKPKIPDEEIAPFGI